MSQFNEKFNELNELVKAVHNTEQDHFDTSRKIKKNIDNYFDEK